MHLLQVSFPVSAALLRLASFSVTTARILTHRESMRDFLLSLSVTITQVWCVLRLSYDTLQSDVGTVPVFFVAWIVVHKWLRHMMWWQRLRGAASMHVPSSNVHAV